MEKLGKLLKKPVYEIKKGKDISRNLGKIFGILLNNNELCKEENELFKINSTLEKNLIIMGVRPPSYYAEIFIPHSNTRGVADYFNKRLCDQSIYNKETYEETLRKIKGGTYYYHENPEYTAAIIEDCTGFSGSWSMNYSCFLHLKNLKKYLFKQYNKDKTWDRIMNKLEKNRDKRKSL